MIPDVDYFNIENTKPIVFGTVKNGPLR